MGFRDREIKEADIPAPDRVASPPPDWEDIPTAPEPEPERVPEKVPA